MKSILWLLCFISTPLWAQNYVDLLKIGYGQTFSNDFENTLSSTEVSSLDIDLTAPVPLSKKQVLITGATYGKYRLQLAPEAAYSNLFSTTLKLGLASTYSETWSSTLVLLPKIASDYENITGNDFYLGGFALLKYQKNQQLTYRMGAYASQEAFGFFAVPIFGAYYLSPNERFEMDLSMPISGDINYRLSKVSLGMDYYGIGRSFNLTGANTDHVYVDVSSLDFALYAQIAALENSVLLRAKLGYATTDFEVYQQGDTVPFTLSAFSFGDNRTQLNPTISGGLYFRVEALYRFHLGNPKQ